MNPIRTYVEQILSGSTPDKPLWNIEKLREGKINGWNYIDGCMMIALLNLHEITGEKKYFDFAEQFLDYYVREDGSLLGYKEDDYNLDNLCEGRPLFDVYAATGKEKYRRAIETLHDQVLRQPRTAEGNFWHKAIYPHQVWLDGLYMAQVFYTKYTSVYENGQNYGDILSQFRTVRDKMRDSATGLYRHGWDSSGKAFWCGEDGRSKNPWLRSLGWFSAALVDVSEAAGSGGEELREELGGIARGLAASLEKYIDPKSGMLWQVPDQIGREGNYPETSGSAMVAYFFLKGARLGILDERYAPIGAGIFESICKTYLTSRDGRLNLGGICLVAGLGPETNRRRDGSYEYYISEPVVENDAKGLAPFLLSYTELLRTGQDFDPSQAR